MADASAGLAEARAEHKGHGFTAIVTAGFVAGSIDLAQAYFFFGQRVPFLIAGGLLGRQAFQRGAGTYALGIFLHFFIACSVAGVYYLASRKLPFLIEHWIVCGLIFGAVVEEVMHLVVLPLSALHIRGPFKLEDLILGLSVHMITVGLPVSFTIRRFSRWT
jgi:hypothetical protein